MASRIVITRTRFDALLEANPIFDSKGVPENDEIWSILTDAFGKDGKLDLIIDFVLNDERLNPTK